MQQSAHRAPPEPRTAATPNEFVRRLRELRLWAGEPSLRALRRLAETGADGAAGHGALLPASTVSTLLRGRELPRLEFVDAFVTACLTARGRTADLAEQIRHWRTSWLRLRRAEPVHPWVSIAEVRPPNGPDPALTPGQDLPRTADAAPAKTPDRTLRPSAGVRCARTTRTRRIRSRAETHSLQ